MTFQKGNIPWNKGKEYLQITGFKNPNWIGGKIVKTFCGFCGKKIFKYPSQTKVGRGKYCSKSCARKINSSGENNPKWKGGGINKNCLICNKQIKIQPNTIKNGRGKFCSRGCANQFIFKNLWRNKEWSEKQHKLMLRGLIKRPTSLEKQMMEIIQKHNLPYKYTGNGDFWIGGKNPDFVNINGEKKLIEVGNVFHHQGDYIEKRREHFAKYGWKSFIFIQDELDENEILKEIL